MHALAVSGYAKLMGSRQRSCDGPHSVNLPNLSLFHLVRRSSVPASEKPPLLLLLHGVGSNEEDLFALAPLLNSRFLVICARGPITLEPNAYAWYHVTWTAQGPVHRPDEVEASRQKLVSFLDEVVAAYRADPEQVYVAGFSQGGAMTFCLVTTVPDKLAGAVIMSGRTISEMEPRIASPEKLKGLPVLVVHGTEDRALPVSFGQEVRDWFKRLPVELDYREYRMAHEISSRSLADIQEWLTARLRD
jgi:phospholipase/carboxylesterase